MEFVPKGRAVVAKVATPLALRVWPAPSAVLPLKKVTVPVGVPIPDTPGVIVAVNVTD
jgi:hypothetical protein